MMIPFHFHGENRPENLMGLITSQPWLLIHGLVRLAKARSKFCMITHDKLAPLQGLVFLQHFNNVFKIKNAN
jgi:hypothetical protein